MNINKTELMAISAPAWRRIAALIYDTLILLAISFLYGALLTMVSVQLGNTPEEYKPMFSSPLFLLGWIFCLTIFYCWFWHKSGQTIGMKTWRLKLVQESHIHLPPTWGQCFIRALVSPPSNLLFGFGYWYQWLNVNRDCLQDKISNTKVIVLKKGA